MPEPAIELDELQWRAPEWTQMYGLRTDNVLEYFSLSPFYDRSSNNQVLKMQSSYNEQLQNRTDLQKELKNMKGLEFTLAVAQEPDVWIIRRQMRFSPTEAEIIATYFVVGENIYQAPSIYSVVASRLLSTTKYLNEALDVARSLPKFTPTGYTYEEKAAPTEGQDQEEEEHSEDEQDALGMEQALNTSLAMRR